MDAVKEHVFATIQDVVGRKKGKIHPAHALYGADLCPLLADYPATDVSAALNALCLEKRIRWGNTMNDKYFIPL